LGFVYEMGLDFWKCEKTWYRYSILGYTRECLIKKVEKDKLLLRCRYIEVKPLFADGACQEVRLSWRIFRFL
jgi:hypothetical protein